VDSAIILAIFTGVAYAVGHTIDLRDAAELGIPESLLREATRETVLLVGGMYLLRVGLIALLVYAIGSYILSMPTFNHWAGRVRERINVHPTFYLIFASIAVPTDAVVSVYFTPFGKDWYYKDEHLADVTKVQVSIANHPVSGRTDLKLLSRRNGLIVLKVKDRKEFFVLKEGDVQVLQLKAAAQPPTGAGGRGTPQVRSPALEVYSSKRPGSVNAPIAQLSL
jgi:hypothetical protein